MNNISINYKGKKILIPVKRVSYLGKYLGLMFKSKRYSKNLLFDFGTPTRAGIHSFFVNFTFLGIWLDAKNNVIMVRRVRPWTALVRPKQKFVKLIEIPIIPKNYGLLKKFELK